MIDLIVPEEAIRNDEPVEWVILIMNYMRTDLRNLIIGAK